MAPRLQFLRPYTSQLSSVGTPARCSAYLRLYELARASKSQECPRRHSSSSTAGVGDQSPEERGALRAQRIKELSHAHALEYPRFSFSGKPTSTRKFCAEFQNMDPTEFSNARARYCIHGRILHIRRHGPKFSFVTIIHDGVPLQVMLNQRKLLDGTEPEAFKKLTMLLQRGDHISVSGGPALSDSGQLCIEARSLPQLFSPSIVPLPHKLSEESRMHNRHLDLLINQASRETLFLRDFIIRHLRSHLQKTLHCIEVQTPILAANAGGAVARPFATQSTEFPHKELALRIAPELWLKRLVVAGFDKVYEIGPSFRNEGIDATHNPEFTTCEFYLAHNNLSSLIYITQTLFHGMAKSLASHQAKFPSLSIPDAKTFEANYEQVEFIPAIEQALGRSLPDLSTPQALPDIINILTEEGKDWHHSLPPNPSLPKLLDHIAAAVIEPQSKGRPLFIIHHPVCMSPLSKSFTCPTTGQQVAARAELFYDGNELANMYEEENDPRKQRRKFQAQARTRQAQLPEGATAKDVDDPAHVIDEQYISVLESGLPPTGGWGCGVDRLVMLFSGAKRISDVLPFGNLRNVVGLASVGAQKQEHSEASAAVAEDAGDEVREVRQSAKEAGQVKRDRAMLDPFLFADEEEDFLERNANDQVNEILHRQKQKSPKIFEDEN